MVNMLFMHEGTTVIEIRPKSDTNMVFFYMAGNAKLKHFGYVADDGDFEGPVHTNISRITPLLVSVLAPAVEFNHMKSRK